MSRVALITGASRGIGAFLAQRLVADGWAVASVSRTCAEVESAREMSFPMDVTDVESVRAGIRRVQRHFGGLDAVVNNAGIAPAGKFLEQDDRVWEEVFAINVTAPALLAKVAGRHMIAQGSGKIINIASTSGILGKALLVAYSSSKGAVLQFTKALAAELARKGVQVNAIAPGAFATDAQRVVLDSPDLHARRVAKIPAKRMADSDEIGPMVCYLASPLSDFVTGSVFVIDGGESSKL